MVEKPGTIPRGAMLFQFSFSPLAWRLEPEGVGKKKKEEMPFVAGSLFLLFAWYHNSSEEQSDIRKVTHIVTHRIGASEAFQIETTATPFVLFLFSSVFLFLLSLYYYPLLGNACDILFTLHRDESERAVVKMH